MPEITNSQDESQDKSKSAAGAANTGSANAGADNAGKSQDKTKQIASIKKNAVTRHENDLKQKFADRGFDLSDFSDEALDAFAEKVSGKKPAAKKATDDKGEQPNAQEVIDGYIAKTEVEKELSVLSYVNDKASRQALTLVKDAYEVKNTKKGIRVYQDGKIVTDDNDNPITVKQAVEQFATENTHLLDGKNRGGVTGTRQRGLPASQGFDFNDLIRSKLGR